MKTEIHLNEEMGYNMYQTIIKYDLKNNLEIGSWDGEGSTNCFVEAMKLLSGERKLQCIEVNQEKFAVLQARYINIPFVSCFNGTSVAYDTLLYKSFDEIWNSSFNMLKTKYEKDVVRGWFERDIESIKNAIPFTYASQYDSVLIDGSEFTGYSDFKQIEDRTKFLFLDDVHNAFKCNQIYQELKQNAKWSIIVDMPNARNGACIFQKQ